ncbi:hypothetical protein BC629DRAFT_1530971 [Irpex lacteus]|nr:hypothetical protein BC629DRAFT_1530971 [Irpex lacteus]
MLKLPFESDIRTMSGVKYGQGDRTLRLIVTPSCQHPDSLVAMVKQLIDCIHEMRYSADGSIMHRKSSEGADDFILVDFDLAANSVGSFSPWNRLGTLPFMPYDLVVDIARRERNKGNPATHCVRFDFESLFWVAAWCSDTYNAVAGVKRTIMTTPGELESAPLSPAFQHLRGWLLAFKRPFAQAIIEEMNANWKYTDKESDTEVTRDTLMEALKTYEAKRAAKRKAGSSRVG